jgi:hypothetical protein
VSATHAPFKQRSFGVHLLLSASQAAPSLSGNEQVPLEQVPLRCRQPLVVLTQSAFEQQAAFGTHVAPHCL